MLSLLRLRGLRYTLVGTLVLATLWVTSLSLLSARSTATGLLTEVGTQVLNPFLVAHGQGLSESGYASLQASARAHPTQSLSLSVLKAKVLGHEIVGKTYADGVRVVYGRVAETYYDGGAQAAFQLPPELKSALVTFGMFNPSNLPQLPQSVGGQSVPQVPQLPQIPSFLQPFFTVVGLTPDTFTAAGHARLVNLLPYFWIALAVLFVVSVIFNPKGNKLKGLLHSVVHGSWPVVAVLVGLWVLSRVKPVEFGPYVGALGLVSQAFLPVYGGALALGVVGIVVSKLLFSRQGAAASVREPALAGVPAGQGMPQGWAELGQALQSRRESAQSAPSSGGPGHVEPSYGGTAWQQPSASAPGWSGPAGQGGQRGGDKPEWAGSAAPATPASPGWQQPGTGEQGWSGPASPRMPEVPAEWQQSGSGGQGWAQQPPAERPQPGYDEPRWASGQTPAGGETSPSGPLNEGGTGRW
jgi:hypothetical protein